MISEFRILYIFLSILPLVTLDGLLESKSKNSPKNYSETTIPVYNFQALEPLLQTNSQEVHIVNFWAMWCAPCVKELSIFQEYQHKNPNTSMLLVSLDFPEDIETSLKPFLKKKNITSKVVLLDDPDANNWINKVSPNWSGSIPFTVIFNNKNRLFYEGDFENIQDLENLIKKL